MRSFKPNNTGRSPYAQPIARKNHQPNYPEFSSGSLRRRWRWRRFNTGESKFCGGQFQYRCRQLKRSGDKFQCGRNQFRRDYIINCKQ